MEPNTATPQPITQVAPPKSNLPLIVGAIVCMVLIGVGSYFLGKKSEQVANVAQPTPTPGITEIPASTATPIQSKTTVVSIDEKTSKYTNNEYGFAITFPKSANNAACISDSSWDYKPSETKILEDSTNNQLYLTFPNTAVHNERVNSSGAVESYNCHSVPVNLSLIQGGYSTGLVVPSQTPMKMYPTNMRFSYAKLQNEADLLAFGKKVIIDDPACVKIITRATDDPNIEDVKLVNKDGTATMEACATNWVYEYLYNKKTNVAVQWSIGQSCPWPIIGTDKVSNCGAKVEFIQ